MAPKLIEPAQVDPGMDDGTYTKILQHWGVESGALDKAEINPAVE